MRFCLLWQILYLKLCLTWPHLDTLAELDDRVGRTKMNHLNDVMAHGGGDRLGCVTQLLHHFCGKDRCFQRLRYRMGGHKKALIEQTIIAKGM